MVNSKTDALLDLQKGGCAALKGPPIGARRQLSLHSLIVLNPGTGSAADLPGLHEYGFSVIEGYLESKIQRGQTASQARTKLDELELVRR